MHERPNPLPAWPKPARSEVWGWRICAVLAVIYAVEAFCWLVLGWLPFQ